MMLEVTIHRRTRYLVFGDDPIAAGEVALAFDRSATAGLALRVVKVDDDYAIGTVEKLVKAPA